MRSKFAKINIIWGVVSQAIIMILNFISRSFFIYTLGKEYLGLNGLFANILTVLSLSELGFGTAIIYNLYKPLSEEDYDQTSVLMKFYKKVYFVIGMVINLTGLALLPFLQYIVKFESNVDINYKLVFIFFLIDTSTTYFFKAYKRSLLEADQKSYILKKYDTIFKSLITIVQIMILLITHNFYSYLMVGIVGKIILNIALSVKVDKEYPLLNEHIEKTLSKRDKKNLFKNVYSLSLYKASTVAVNSTDNIIISSFISTTVVGIYSNYSMVISTINTFLGVIFLPLVASVGNLNVTSDDSRKRDIFDIIYFTTFWLYGICFVCLYFLLNDFIKIWVGGEFILDNLTVLVICTSFLIKGMENPTYIYRMGCGAFNQAKYRPVISAVLNILFSILFVKSLGIAGIFIGTILSRMLTYFIFDPIIVFRDILKLKPVQYYLKYIWYIIVIIIGTMITGYFLQVISFNGIGGFILKGVLCFIIVNIVFIIVTFTTKEFKNTLKYALNMLNK